MKQLKLFFALFAMLALGVGNAWGAEETVSWTATTNSLGSAISNVNGTATGTIKTGDFVWNYTRTLTSLKSGKTDYVQMSNGYMQCGSSNAINSLKFQTSNIPGTIKSVAVDCASYQGKHNISITVGGTTYLAKTAVPTWSSNKGGVKTGTGTSSGEIIISFTDGTRALYIKSITVVYEETSGSGSGETVVKTLQSIAVAGMTTSYQVGDDFSFDGTCTATYSVTKDGVAQPDVVSETVTPTSVSTPDMTQVGTPTVTVTYTEGEVTKTAEYAITIEEAPTYNFRKIEGFSDWGSSYVEHIVEYTDAKATFVSANKQSNTITDQPVTKGSDVSLVLKDGMNIATVKWVCTQWTTKAQTITLHYSKDGGVSYTSTGITSENFTISSDNLPAGTNAVKITFSSANQVGIKSCTITKVEAAAITQVPAPQFSLPAGAYDGAQNVELTCTMADATIHYTTDGTTPTTSSAVYSTAIQVAENMTIKAYAVKEGLEDSPVVEATYEISAPADVVLDFTTNDTWNFPVGYDNKGTAETSYTDGTNTIKVAAGNAYYYDETNTNLLLGKKDAYIMLPVFDKPIVKIVCEGHSSGSGSVTFNVFVDDDAVSTAVTGCKANQTFLIAEDKQVANVAHVIKVTNENNLRIAKIKIYLGEAPAVERPIIGGEEEFAGSTEVSITCATSGAKIYYTTDGTEPTNASAEYTAPFELSATTTVKAIAYADGQASAVATKTFTFIETITCVQAAEIALAQSANNVQTEKKYRIIAYVTETLSSVSSNQQSFKVVDNIGDESVFQSYYCNVPEAMAAGMKVEMIGKLSKYNTTAQMKNGDVTILEKPVAAPKILGAEAFETSTEVTITAEEGMQIYYTLDGATPTTGSTKYTAAFTLSATTTVKAIAYNSTTAKSSTVVEKTFTKTAITTKTIAEFIASQGGACYLEGTVSNITNTTYGNFDLTDETGTIYIYGCLNANGESKKFAELGVKEGDLLKVQANVYEFYNNEKHEAKNVVYVSHVSNSEEPEAPNPGEGNIVTFDATEDEAANNSEAGAGQITKSPITFACSNGIIGKKTNNHYRLYKNSETTFTAEPGYAITKIVFNCIETHPASGFGNSNEGYSSDELVGTWSGSANEVVLTATSAQVRATKITVTYELQPYTRTVTSGNYGTICLPFGSTNYSGATFYEFVGSETGKVYLGSVTTLEAGVPYIFEASANELAVYSNGTTTDKAGNKNGLHGTFDNDTEVAVGNYILKGNKLCQAVAICYVNANRAYIVMSEVPNGEPNKVAGRKYIGMDVQGENVETGVEDLFTTDAPVKVIENGQLIIIRDGVKYNVQGQVIK